ncbi:MAG: hypothetical protein JXL81_08055, partial [Deltaproteobacteria bacterium]|nr:hypothetical protein [Deltaproteobacteria bacterium]
DQISKKEITDNTVISIFHKNEWIPWQEFVKDASLLVTFTSGKDYSFRFSGEGFITKYANISVDPEQTLLNLDVMLTPLPGELYINTKIPDLILLLNNSSYYPDGSKSPSYKRIPPLDTTGQKISLPAGDYILTVKEKAPLWKRISLFPPKLFPLRSDTLKITIRRGETLNVLCNINIADGAIKLEIQ